MTPLIFSDAPVALLGGAAAADALVERVLALCGPVVAADSGAALARAAGIEPAAVIGDMDSIAPDLRAALPTRLVHEITEQESTDFEKCLTRIAAPLVIGAGFLGARADHMLAAFSVIARHPGRRCILAGAEDVVFVAPPELTLALDTGSRLSLFPMRAVSGRSEGLEWPIEGLDFAPDGRIGTSNRVTGPVTLAFDAPGMLVILPAEALEETVRGVLSAPQWRVL